MAEEQFEPREINFRQWLPWTQIFRGFWVAMDPKKLLLAAAGILTMAFGWWLLATIFYNIKTQPVWPGRYLGGTKYATDELAFAAFRNDRDHWNLLYEAAGPPSDAQKIEPNDLASSPQEFDLLQDVVNEKEGARAKAAASPLLQVTEKDAARIQSLLVPRKETPRVEPGSNKVSYLGLPKRHAELRTWPWWEERGPNPFLLVTGKDKEGAWEKGHFLDWFLRDQLPVLIEPLVKFFRPIAYLLSPYAGFVEGLYFLLVLAWTVASWAIFGGAITRIAAVELARNDKIGLGEAMRYVISRWTTYLFASFGPVLLLIGFAVLPLIVLFGIPNLVPVVAEFWVGLLLPLALGFGLLMAIILVCLPGWPMVHATLGTEGSDSFDALSRSGSYVLQKPWSFVWYAAVAIVYGAILVFFVVLMGSLMVYLAKWGIGLVAYRGESYNRDPSYLFLWAPTSFGWRELLLQGSSIDMSTFRWWNYIGPFLVAIWLGLGFLMIIGFGYSYFWSASTIIYLLMRRKVDDTEFDEVYLEEEEPEETYTSPAAAPLPSPQPAPSASTGLQMVEAPALRTTTVTATPSPSPSPVAEETAVNPGDGNLPAEGTASS